MAVGLATENFSGLKFENVYHPQFDLSGISAEDRERMKRHDANNPFPVALVVVLHFVTFGIFTLIYMGLKHSRFPRIRHDDFGAGRAIGFMFIPLFDIYWVFMFWVRLASRINLQFRLRNLPEPVPRGLIITTLILNFIPYLNFISAAILYPVCMGMIQSAYNRLVRESA